MDKKTKPTPASKQVASEPQDKNGKPVRVEHKVEHSMEIDGKDVTDIIGHPPEKETYTKEEVFDIIGRLSQYMYDRLLSGKQCLVYARTHVRDSVNGDAEVMRNVQDKQVTKQDHDMVGSLYGQMMSLIESTFPNVNQQSSVKSLTRNIFNHTINDHHNFIENSLSGLFYDPFGRDMSKDMQAIRNMMFRR